MKLLYMKDLYDHMPKGECDLGLLVGLSVCLSVSCKSLEATRGFIQLVAVFNSIFLLSIYKQRVWIHAALPVDKCGTTTLSHCFELPVKIITVCFVQKFSHSNDPMSLFLCVSVQCLMVCMRACA